MSEDPDDVIAHRYLILDQHSSYPNMLLRSITTSMIPRILGRYLVLNRCPNKALHISSRQQPAILVPTQSRSPLQIRTFAAKSEADGKIEEIQEL